MSSLTSNSRKKVVLGREVLRAESSGPLGSSLTCSFVLPFLRPEVFAELSLARAPLGVDLSNCAVSVSKSAADARELEELEEGCVRAVVFASQVHCHSSCTRRPNWYSKYTHPADQSYT
eukprot:6105938-Prymnesium_polylepis.3